MISGPIYRIESDLDQIFMIKCFSEIPATMSTVVWGTELIGAGLPLKQV